MLAIYQFALCGERRANDCAANSAPPTLRRHLRPPDYPFALRWGCWNRLASLFSVAGRESWLLPTKHWCSAASISEMLNGHFGSTGFLCGPKENERGVRPIVSDSESAEDVAIGVTRRQSD